MGDARHPGIVGEGGEQRVQQVGATVDIADRADQMVGVERPGSVHPVASLDRHHAVTKPQKPTTRQGGAGLTRWGEGRSEEHTSELQSLMRISYAVFCLKKKTKIQTRIPTQSESQNQ